MPSRYDQGASSDDLKQIITEDVMLLAAIIVRRHLTTLYVLVSRLYKSCPEMDSGREFRVGVSPKTKWHRLEEVMCTWIMCTWEQALVREVCVCRKACFCRSIVLGTV